jgi:hypothetical protein
MKRMIKQKSDKIVQKPNETQGDLQWVVQKMAIFPYFMYK